MYYKVKIFDGVWFRRWKYLQEDGGMEYQGENTKGRGHIDKEGEREGDSAIVLPLKLFLSQEIY